MPPIRVLIVDDSMLVREALHEVLHSDPEIEIAGTVSSGKLALPLVTKLRPTLVILDLALPGMDGPGTLAEIRKLRPQLPVIMFSTFTERCAAVKIEAPAWGFTDYIAKPLRECSSRAVQQRFRDELISKIKALCGRPRPYHPPTPRAAPAPARPRFPIDIVVIGASTGGPEALTDMIPQFPADFPVPILIVQHMPAKFTRLLAERIDSLSPMAVLEGSWEKKIGPGQVWIAPGDYHMAVSRRIGDVVLTLNQKPAEQGCRPAVDVLFRSVAEVFGPNVLAVVLTGMGADGSSGAQAIWAAGGEVVVQDEATSTIWGMPGRVVAAGFADCVYPLSSMASEILRRVYSSRRLPKLAHAAVAR